MGKPKPKKTQQTWSPEANTQTFRALAAEKLADNAAHNAFGSYRLGNDLYRIESHADIARELSALTGKTIGQTQVSNILGGARDGTEVELVDSSKYIPLIRKILGLERQEILVPVERAEVMQRIADLPEKDFARHREALEAKKP